MALWEAAPRCGKKKSKRKFDQDQDLVGFLVKNASEIIEIHIWLVATQIFLEFSPRFVGEMIQFDEHIFEMGWNHQLDIISLAILLVTFLGWLSARFKG